MYDNNRKDSILFRRPLIETHIYIYNMNNKIREKTKMSSNKTLIIIINLLCYLSFLR